MEVILLERIARLGQMGDVVRVKDGFARNFLLPRGKALRATDENRTRFEKMKGELEARSLTLKTESDQVAGKLDGKSFTVLRQASESGQLFGSVSPRDLVTLLGEAGFRLNRNQVVLNGPIKTVGQHKVPIALGATHHRRGPVFMSIDPDREIANNILIEPFEAFNFVDRRRRRIDVH